MMIYLNNGGVDPKSLLGKFIVFWVVLLLVISLVAPILVVFLS